MSVSLQPARSMDAGAVAEILSRNVDHAEWLPRIYTRAEELGFADQMIGAGWVVVARFEGYVMGFSARSGTELYALYVMPEVHGHGIGKALLDQAKLAAGPKLGLWSYQANSGATRFYQREGFVERERTNGAGNDAKLPDIRYEWMRPS